MYWSMTLGIVILLSPVLDAAEHWKRHAIDDTSRGADGVRLADINGDGLPDVATGWEEGGITRVYLHPGKEKVKQRWPAVTVGTTKAVEDAVFADLDSDGQPDVVTCCEGGTKSIFVHWSPRERERLTDASAWKQELLPASKGMMAWMFAIPAQIDGQGATDLIVAGKGGGAAIGWWEAPKDSRDLSAWQWHPIAKAGWVMSLIIEDMDGDGDVDVVASDRKGTLRACRWFENPGKGEEQRKPWPEHLIGGKGRSVMFMTLADIDGDGLRDAVTVANSDVLIFKRQDKSGRRWTEESVAYPPESGSAKAVAIGDLDGDGTPELVLSCENATPPKSGVLSMKRTPRGWHGSSVSGPDGIKFDRIELLDIDGDGDLDIMTCEERHNRGGLGVVWYENPSRNTQPE